MTNQSDEGKPTESAQQGDPNMLQEVDETIWDKVIDARNDLVAMDVSDPACSDMRDQVVLVFDILMQGLIENFPLVAPSTPVSAPQETFPDDKILASRDRRSFDAGFAAGADYIELARDYARQLVERAVRDRIDDDWLAAATDFLKKTSGQEEPKKCSAETVSVASMTETIPAKTSRTTSRSCNRHNDCDAAEQEVMARRGIKRHEISYGFHCHIEDCEDCFGC